MNCIENQEQSSKHLLTPQIKITNKTYVCFVWVFVSSFVFVKVVKLSIRL